MTSLSERFTGHKDATTSRSNDIIKMPVSVDIDTEWKLAKFLQNSLNCQRVFGGDLAYAFDRKFFIVDPPQEELPMDCKSIFTRNGFDERNGWIETSKEERQFPLAFARIVFKDYAFLESEFAVHYAPQNWYCYVVDSKADMLFRKRITQLAKCFSNVIVTQREFSISSQGHNTSDAMIECARELVQSDQKRDWKYLVALQNHDIQAKTNAEMVRIFRRLNGANDIEVAPLDSPTISERISYYINEFDWSFENLTLFRNESKNKSRHGSTTLSNNFDGKKATDDTILHIGKGYSTASLSREFIEFIVRQLDLDKVLEQLNKAPFGVDEHLWQSLCTTDTIQAPGCFPRNCYENVTTRPFFFTRFAIWQNEMQLPCRSGNWRHMVCVLGLEDLTNSELFDLPHLFVNKMMPDYDYAAIKCWHEQMRHRRNKYLEQKTVNKYVSHWFKDEYNKCRQHKKI